MSKARVDGSALVAVILVTLIFFIIAVVVSSIVTLQARAAFEEELADMSFFMADAGVRLGAARATYRFFLRTVYDPDAVEIIDKTYNTGDPDYTANYTLQIYELTPVYGDPEGYTNSNVVFCVSRIYRQPEDVMIAKRKIFVNVYLKDDPANGGVDAKLKDYYEENR